MAIISSHVLDSVIGDHARGIRIALFRISKNAVRTKLFDVIANNEGRILEQIEAISDEAVYELVFDTAVYFKSHPEMPKARQIMDEVVVRFKIPEPDEKIHIPLVLSPHSYTIWWSA